MVSFRKTTKHSNQHMGKGQPLSWLKKLSKKNSDSIQTWFEAFKKSPKNIKIASSNAIIKSNKCLAKRTKTQTSYTGKKHSKIFLIYTKFKHHQPTHQHFLCTAKKYKARLRCSTTPIRAPTTAAIHLNRCQVHNFDPRLVDLSAPLFTLSSSL
jgi:hypothetical protein